ncbi:MAG: serine/threonine-protein kinase [Pseudomonadales bacterium]
MSDPRWERLQQIFHEAAALPEAERSAFVSAQCGADLEMRDELLRLLQAEVDPERVVSAELDQIDSAAELALEGTEIGAYRLLRRIGSGGMGSVYLAERADGTFERQVALKVVKRGMDSERVVQRFRVERQILARLNHPNIARLLDGGITDDGRPYFVMEYVEGLPITEYCDRHHVSVAARLRLFQKVCSAVQYAHQSLVVHRDLKPSNILVTGDGEVRLLDFGIAKLLDASEDEALTGTGAQLLTPAYAAPEQLLSESVTTMTDVYSLGVILYELLAGRRPYETRKSAAEYRREVLSSDPVRPSTALSQLPATDDGRPDLSAAQAIADSRGVQITRLRALLRGDLDTICLMALRREPDKRYASAEQLAADVQRFIDGRPVLARRDTLSYRLGKYLRRHRVGVTASVLGVVLFLATIGYYTSELARERDLALDEQRKSSEVVKFVLGLFEVADPAVSRGEEITARELLDAGAQRVRTQLTDRPGVQATMMRVLGDVYHELNLTDEALGLLQTALDEQRALYGEVSAEVATTELSLGIVHQTRGEFDDAERLIYAAVDTRSRLAGGDSYELLEAVSAAAFLQESIGNYEEAERLHLQALDQARRLAGGRDDEYLAQAMARLASIYRLQDRPAEAEPLLRQALAMQNRVYGGPHPESDETRRQLAELLANQRQYDEAEALYKELIASREKMMGPDHYELGSVWNSYGHLLAARGETEKAIAAYEKMIDITRRSYGDVHPSLAAGYNNLAVLYRNREEFDKALENYQLCIDMQDAAELDPAHPNRSFPIAGLGSVYLRLRQFDKAEAYLQQALALRRAAFDEEHTLISEVKSDLGATWLGLGRIDEAEQILLEVYQLFMRDWGPDDMRTRRAAGRLVQLYEQRGEQAVADQYRAVAFTPEEDVMLR